MVFVMHDKLILGIEERSLCLFRCEKKVDRGRTNENKKEKKA